ncbi:hypothetical protein AeMF1_011859 [Aphanomyces euteiches]|nr:hypothetical protein AeMF1_011859 [Aphanomyces euteiches]
MEGIKVVSDEAMNPCFSKEAVEILKKYMLEKNMSTTKRDFGLRQVVARQLNCSEARVMNWLRNYKQRIVHRCNRDGTSTWRMKGINVVSDEAMNPCFSKKAVEILKKYLFEKNLSTTKRDFGLRQVVARQLNCSEARVMNWLRNYKWKNRVRGTPNISAILNQQALLPQNVRAAPNSPLAATLNEHEGVTTEPHKQKERDHLGVQDDMPPVGAMSVIERAEWTQYWQQSLQTSLDALLKLGHHSILITQHESHQGDSSFDTRGDIAVHAEAHMKNIFDIELRHLLPDVVALRRQYSHLYNQNVSPTKHQEKVWAHVLNELNRELRRLGRPPMATIPWNAVQRGLISFETYGGHSENYTLTLVNWPVDIPKRRLIEESSCDQLLLHLPSIVVKIIPVLPDSLEAIEISNDIIV